MWPQSIEGGKVTANPVKPAVSAEIKAKPKETSSIILSTDHSAPEQKTVTESKPVKAKEIFQEKKAAYAPVQPLSEPKPGAKAVIDGKSKIWIPGFGWIEDHGGGSIRSFVDGKGDINKQVGTMGGTVAEDMYESGIKIGIMCSEETPTGKIVPPQAELSESEDEVVRIILVETPEKNSTSPDYKPNTTPPAP